MKLFTRQNKPCSSLIFYLAIAYMILFASVTHLQAQFTGGTSVNITASGNPSTVYYGPISLVLGANDIDLSAPYHNVTLTVNTTTSQITITIINGVNLNTTFDLVFTGGNFNSLTSVTQNSGSGDIVATKSNSTTVAFTLPHNGGTATGNPATWVWDFVATATGSSTTWNGSSWSNGTPTSTVDAIIASSTTPGSFACKSLTINSAVALTIGSGFTATVNGNITNSGNGISGVGNLTIASSSALSGTAISFNGVLTVNTGATLTTNNLLTLSSNSTATASLAAVAGTVSGTVTVERYIPAHTTKAYTLVSSPVGSPTIYTAWQEGGANTSGYGTKITSTSATNGFDLISAAGIASIYSYNDGNVGSAKWVGLANTNVNTLTSGTGYLLFVRGDRTVGTGVSSSSATTLRATGSLTTGTVNFKTSGGTTGTPNLLASSGTYNLIANPYPCAIDWTNAGVTKTNVSSTFTVYDPNLVVFVTSNGATVAPNTGQQQAKYIQSGQAFFIQSTTAAPQLTISETAKVTGASTGSSNTVFGIVPTAELNINVYKTSAGSDVFADGAVAIFNNNYAKGLDKEDANKFTNFNENVSFERSNTHLSIEGRPLPVGADTLFVNMQQMSSGTDYKVVIDATGFNSSNISNATLIDQLTGTIKQLDLDTKNEYAFTNDAASNNRLMIVLNNASIATVNSMNNDVIVTYPNPVVNELQISSKAMMNTVRLIDAQGISVVTQTNINSLQTKLNVSKLASGMYMVEVTDINGNRVVKKVIK